MAEYIERDALRGDILSNECGYPCETVNYFLGLLDCQPAADVAPVKRGEWVEREIPHEDSEETYTVCYTACGQCGAGRSAGLGLANFCPNCGAKMTGENA